MRKRLPRRDIGDWASSAIGGSAEQFRENIRAIRDPLCSPTPYVGPSGQPDFDRALEMLEACQRCWEAGRDHNAVDFLCEAAKSYAFAFASSDTEAAFKGRALAGATTRLANDPKQSAKKVAQKLWEEWQSGKRLHASTAAFARFVVREQPVIQSTQVVERWCRAWSKEKRTEQA